MVRRTQHYKGRDYSGKGGVTNNGHNSFLRRGNYPETKQMQLWPKDYAEALRYYDRVNWIVRNPTPLTPRCPSLGFVNTQYGFPQAWSLPASEVSPLAPFAGAVEGVSDASTYAAVITAFNAKSRAPNERAMLWELFAMVCEQTGVPLSQPVLTAGASRDFAEFQRVLQLAAEFAKDAAEELRHDTFTAHLLDEDACGAVLAMLRRVAPDPVAEAVEGTAAQGGKRKRDALIPAVPALATTVAAVPTAVAAVAAVAAVPTAGAAVDAWSASSSPLSPP